MGKKKAAKKTATKQVAARRKKTAQQLDSNQFRRRGAISLFLGDFSSEQALHAYLSETFPIDFGFDIDPRSKPEIQVSADESCWVEDLLKDLPLAAKFITPVTKALAREGWHRSQAAVLFYDFCYDPMIYKLFNGFGRLKFLGTFCLPEKRWVSAVELQRSEAADRKGAAAPGNASGASMGDYWAEHARLWDELVPASGQAKTIQGEVIRIVGKLTREAYANGNMNWDASCALLWRFVARTLDDLETFTKQERSQIKDWVKAIIRDHRDPDLSGEGSPYYSVTEKAVAWVLAHPKPIRHVPDPKVKR